MKLVLSSCGDYFVPEALRESHKWGPYCDDLNVRSHPDFLAYAKTEDYYSYKIVDLPEEATDYLIKQDEYEEILIYVVDGKIFIK